VPDTIQEVLLARIDRLADEPRRLLQTAAVVGQEVPLALLRAVWEGEPDLHLRELMRLEFLHAKAGGGEPICAFTHSLTRDVAYESVPLSRRRVLHGAIARALEAVYADRLAEVYDRLAYHYGRTDEAAKAVLYLEQLAKKAVGAHAHAEAVRILEEARTHVDRLPAAEQDRRRLELALSQAYSLIPLGAFQASSPCCSGTRSRWRAWTTRASPARITSCSDGATRSWGTSGRRHTISGWGWWKRCAAGTTRREVGSTTCSPSTTPCRAVRGTVSSTPGRRSPSSSARESSGGSGRPTGRSG
jgi:hypothetical protein